MNSDSEKCLAVIFPICKLIYSLSKEPKGIEAETDTTKYSTHTTEVVKIIHSQFPAMKQKNAEAKIARNTPVSNLWVLTQFHAITMYFHIVFNVLVLIKYTFNSFCKSSKITTYMYQPHYLMILQEKACSDWLQSHNHSSQW